MSDELLIRSAKYSPGQMVKHRHHAFYGVIIDIDIEFNQTDEWLESIPEEFRPIKEQPYYHLLADNGETVYMAYVSEQNLEIDSQHKEFVSDHESLSNYFVKKSDGYSLSSRLVH